MLLCCVISCNRLIVHPKSFETGTRSGAGGSSPVMAVLALGLVRGLRTSSMYTVESPQNSLTLWGCILPREPSGTFWNVPVSVVPASQSWSWARHGRGGAVVVPTPSHAVPPAGRWCVPGDALHGSRPVPLQWRPFSLNWPYCVNPTAWTDKGRAFYFCCAVWERGGERIAINQHVVLWCLSKVEPYSNPPGRLTVENSLPE